MRSNTVRCRNYNIDRNFAVTFVTKEFTTLLFCFYHVGIEEHRWCSGSIADLQAIDMGLIPVGRKGPSLIASFLENIASDGFESIIIYTVPVWVDRDRWRSGSIVKFQALNEGSIPVRWSNRVSKLFSSLFDTDEFSILRFSFFRYELTSFVDEVVA